MVNVVALISEYVIFSTLSSVTRANYKSKKNRGVALFVTTNKSMSVFVMRSPKNRNVVSYLTSVSNLFPNTCRVSVDKVHVQCLFFCTHANLALKNVYIQ